MTMRGKKWKEAKRWEGCFTLMPCISLCIVWTLLICISYFVCIERDNLFAYFFFIFFLFFFVRYVFYILSRQSKFRWKKVLSSLSFDSPDWSHCINIDKLCASLLLTIILSIQSAAHCTHTHTHNEHLIIDAVECWVENGWNERVWAAWQVRYMLSVDCLKFARSINELNLCIWYMHWSIFNW